MRWLFWNRRFFVEVKRTVPARPRTVWSHLMSAGWLDGEPQWVTGRSFHLWDGTRIKVRAMRPPHELSFDWVPAVGDRSQVRVALTLTPKGTAITIRQEGFSKDEDRTKLRGRWEKALEALEGSLRRRPAPAGRGHDA